MHVIQMMANNPSVPYFKWLAEEVHNHPEMRFTFIAMCRDRPAMLDEMKERNCDCVWIKFDCEERKSGMTKSFFELLKLFKKLKPDVVHTHLFDDSFPGLLGAKMAGVKKRVITKQDTTFHWYYAPKWVWADKFNNRTATHLIAVTEENKQFILECEGAEPKKIRLVHNGFPFNLMTQQFDDVKQKFIEKYGLQDKIVVGTVSRLIEWKGYRHIINAAERLVKKYPQIHFLFIGEGEQKKELEKTITDKKLQNHITLTDWIERADIPSLYGIMDIYLHAAKFEPFGFVLIEAMFNAVPVVSTATGVAKDAIIHKETGYLVSYEEIEQLADGIEYMIENDRKAIGMKAKEAALKEYQFENMFNGYKKIYFEENF
jgi:glycosyltransferase involved in cell wall biosynthesis